MKEETLVRRIRRELRMAKMSDWMVFNKRKLCRDLLNICEDNEEISEAIRAYLGFPTLAEQMREDLRLEQEEQAFKNGMTD